MKPTKRLLLIAVGGIGMALLPILVEASLWSFWLLFWGALVLLFGVDGLLIPRRSDLSCSVELPPHLYVGQMDDALVRLGVASERPVRADLLLDFSRDLVSQPEVRLTVQNQGLSCPYPLVPRRRGSVTVEEAWVRLWGPLGLTFRVERFILGQSVSVVPNVRPVKKLALRFCSDRQFRAGLKVERYAGDGTEFESLREYLPGNDIRAIDWKASARHRKLFCREYRAERNHQIVLGIDTGRLMSESLYGMPKVDHAIHAALMLSYVCLRTGDRVGFYTFGSEPGLFLEPQGGVKNFQGLVRATEQIEYGTEETNFTLGLTNLGRRLNRRSLVIVLTDFVDTVTAEMMIENLGRLSRRHHVVFVSLTDPDLEAQSLKEPTGLRSLNRSVVAGDLIRDREVVLKRLVRRGMSVIDAQPSQIEPALVNRYLEIKRREMI
ncbi:MAG: DUF58 domain-containing protein [Planctomycetota bacterium]|nr:DUF58 domain-containing protein [Planctomycetota bacterium]